MRRAIYAGLSTSLLAAAASALSSTAALSGAADNLRYVGENPTERPSYSRGAKHRRGRFYARPKPYKGSPQAKRATRRGGNHAAHR